jgi:hypothetical protein
MNSHRGSSLLEAALVVPIVLALLVGTVQLGRIIYTYTMIEKIMLNLARYLGTQQGVNFCDSQDPSVQAAINFALTPSTDSAADSIVANLTADMFQIQIQRYDSNAQQLVACDCSATGCDTSQGGLPPGFIVVSLTDGYTVNPIFWGFRMNAFPLRPSVKVPYGGT